jgi:C4-type Zn-finger protein
MTEVRTPIPHLKLIMTEKLICDDCGRVMKHPERYAYLYMENPPIRLCEDCSRAKGFLISEEDESKGG